MAIEYCNNRPVIVIGNPGIVSTTPVDGVTGVLEFYTGMTPGLVDTMTFVNGILVSYTIIPEPMSFTAFDLEDAGKWS